MQNWIKKTVGFGIASFLSDFSHEMTISFIPILITQFVGAERAPLFLGIIASLGDAFASFLRIIAGYLTDRIAHKKPLIMVGYFISALFSTLVGFAHSAWEALWYRILSFTGSGLREPPRDALMAATIEPMYYGRAFGLQRALDTLGSLIGPLVAFACIQLFSMRMIFILSFIPGILAVLAILLWTQDKTITQKKSFITSTFWQDLSHLPRSFLVFLSILFIFHLGNFNKLLLLSRAQEMLYGHEAGAAKGLVLLYAFFNIARACSEFIIGLLSDFINRILLLALLGFGLFAVTGFMLIASSATFMYCSIAFIIAGMSMATITTLKKACAADMLPDHIRGLGYGILQASEGFALLISSALIGFLWTHISASLAFSYVIIMSLIALFLLLGFIFFKRNQKTFYQASHLE